MPETIYDAVVIGGGPGGSAASTYLGRAGKRVLVLEKEHFPRFHIGESLLPYNLDVLEEMGVLPDIQAEGFPIKYGAQFVLGNASRMFKFTFRSSRYARQTTAFQVERAKFDHILLKHAAKSGVEVREGWSVTKFSNMGDLVDVEACDEKGTTQTFRAKFLIDCSGRGNLTGNQEGLKVVHPKHKKLAVFGHFENVKLDSGITSTDIVIVRLVNKWFWIIPISPVKTSVGCVLERDEFASAKNETPTEIFTRIWQSSTEMRDRMGNARLVNEMRTTSDFSYYNKRLVSHRVLRVGDAAGFMDPIFSAGVYLAMYSGRLAANTVLQALDAGDAGTAGLRAYEKKVSRAIRLYWSLVEGYYTKPFMEVFLKPDKKHHIAEAVIALLAGEMDGGSKLSWRVKFFFWVVKVQGWRPFMPQITFDEPPPRP